MPIILFQILRDIRQGLLQMNRDSRGMFKNMNYENCSKSLKKVFSLKKSPSFFLVNCFIAQRKI